MSDLLTTLLGSMTSEDALKSLTQKTGASSKQATTVVSSALPQLMKALSANASSKEGAASLLGALAQHTNTDPVEKQIAEADEEDGGKILKHILGGNTESVVSGLTKETGLTAKQVSSLLGNITPALMSSVSNSSKSAASKKTTKKEAGVDLSDGIDISDVIGILGMVNGSDKKKGGVLGILGSLFGKK